jgi:hypothetical protein
MGREATGNTDGKENADEPRLVPRNGMVTHVSKDTRAILMNYNDYTTTKSTLYHKSYTCDRTTTHTEHEFAKMTCQNLIKARDSFLVFETCSEAWPKWFSSGTF